MLLYLTNKYDVQVKEYFAQKLAEEAAEAKRAEKLVRELEKKEKEWIAKLRNAQVIQEDAFDQLETALHKDSHEAPPSNRKTGGMSSSMEEDSPKERFRLSGGGGGRESKESAHEYDRQGFDSQGQHREDGNFRLEEQMSEMNMSDPVGAIQSSSSHHSTPQDRTGKGGGSQASGSRASHSSSRDEEIQRKSTASGLSGLTRSSGAGSARGSSAGSGSGAVPKKKVATPASARKAH